MSAPSDSALVLPGMRTLVESDSQPYPSQSPVPRQFTVDWSGAGGTRVDARHRGNAPALGV